MSLSKSKSKSFLTGVLYVIVLATIAAMVAPASAQNWDGRLWKPYQPQQFGGQRRQTDGVYGGVEAIVWKVNELDHIDPWFQSMDFSQVGSDFRAGTRVTFGNRSGHHGWRFSYYGISGLGKGIKQSQTVDWSEGGPLGEYSPGSITEWYSDYSGPPWIGDLVMITEWINVQSQTLSVDASTRVGNIDLAYTYRAHPFSWGDLEMYAGAKYWDFSERLIYMDDNRSNVYRYSFWEGWGLGDSDFTLIFGDSNGRLVTLDFGSTTGNNILDDNPTPLSLSVWRSRNFRAKNRMVGPNLGATLTRRNARWTFGVDAAVFLGVNSQSYSFVETNGVTFHDSTNRYYSVTGTSGGSTGGERDASSLSLSDLRGLQLIKDNIEGLDKNTYYKRHRTVFSPGVSMQLSAQWQWSEAVGVKVAFDSTIIDNVARGSDLIPTTIRDADGKRTGYSYRLRNKGDLVMLYGVTVGLEFRR